LLLCRRSYATRPLQDEAGRSGVTANQCAGASKVPPASRPGVTALSLVDAMTRFAEAPIGQCGLAGGLRGLTVQPSEIACGTLIADKRLPVAAIPRGD